MTYSLEISSENVTNVLCSLRFDLVGELTFFSSTIVFYLSTKTNLISLKFSSNYSELVMNSIFFKFS